MTKASQFERLVLSFLITFSVLLVSVALIGHEIMAFAFGVPAGALYYFFSNKRHGLVSRFVGLASLLAGTAMFFLILYNLAGTHPKLVPVKTELSISQLVLCIVAAILVPCLVFDIGGRLAAHLARENV